MYIFFGGSANYQNTSFSNPQEHTQKVIKICPTAYEELTNIHTDRRITPLYI